MNRPRDGGKLHGESIPNSVYEYLKENDLIRIDSFDGSSDSAKLRVSGLIYVGTTTQGREWLQQNGA